MFFSLFDYQKIAKLFVLRIMEAWKNRMNVSSSFADVFLWNTKKWKILAQKNMFYYLFASDDSFYTLLIFWDLKRFINLLLCWWWNKRCALYWQQKKIFFLKLIKLYFMCFFVELRSALITPNRFCGDLDIMKIRWKIY